jgi:dTDP-4-dehydrorhamnose 3,5-epimerase
MIFSETTIPGAFIIEVQTHGDERGFFGRWWCREEFRKHGLNTGVAQANIGSSAKKGTLRGLHYQRHPHAEAKLIRCVHGRLFDVIVDLRKGSNTYGRWFGTTLEQGNQRMLYAPEGMAHGYLTLADDTEIIYLVSEVYTPEAEAGIRWDDPAFAIDWPLSEGLILSEKDRQWPDFQL